MVVKKTSWLIIKRVQKSMEKEWLAEELKPALIQYVLERQNVVLTLHTVFHTA